MRMLMWALYFIWLSTTAGWLFFAMRQIAEKTFSKLNFMVPVPLISVLVFSYVFIFNRGSNVVQLSESLDLWSFWSTAWIPLSIGNLLCGAIFIVSLFVPFSGAKFEGWSNLAFRVLILVTLASGILLVVSSMPDA